MAKLERLEKKTIFLVQFAFKLQAVICQFSKSQVHKKYNCIRSKLEQGDEFQCQVCESQGIGKNRWFSRHRNK